MINLISIVFLITRFLTFAPLSHAASVQELASISQQHTAAEDIPLDSDDDQERDDCEGGPSCLEDDSLCDVHVLNYFSFQSYWIAARLPFVNHSIAPPPHFIGSVFRPPITSV